MKTSTGIIAILLLTFGFLISIGGLVVTNNIIWICGIILMLIANFILWFDDIKKLFAKSQKEVKEDE